MASITDRLDVIRRWVRLSAAAASGIVAAGVAGVAGAQWIPQDGFALPPGSDAPLFSVPSPIGPFEYRSARGLRFGDTGLNVGGFSTAEVDRDDGEPTKVALDSINFLLLYEPIESFRFFAELEIGDLFDYESDGPTESDPRFDIERLYGEVSVDDPLQFRFGKFQTPVGRWNLVPAEPFVWTASDPVILDTVFDEHQTGAAITGTFFPSIGELEYWIYGQVVDPIDPSDTPPPTDRSVGTRLQLTPSFGAWSVGGSFLASERDGDWSYLGGLDAEVRRGRMELLSELVYQNGSVGELAILGGFLQARYEIVRDVSLVARYEHFDRIGSKRDDVNLGDVGIAWQPFRWLILKGTYRFSDRETDDVQRGLSSSISVVF